MPLKMLEGLLVLNQFTRVPTNKVNLEVLLAIVATNVNLVVCSILDPVLANNP
jgi:hypothetical protein